MDIARREGFTLRYGYADFSRYVGKPTKNLTPSKLPDTLSGKIQSLSP
ncbi:hypothetical protein GXM_05130 [Nostoc sphaeroides CCNUC1]|uniref:Uncharacterized protein n=1 Tax=Nostoc sphaeroides CCNUC1 TaxID=2653204 RepID=A0A5P8W4H1_9NOSO|nr:hypothetical protein GXM_05130 [Nostoc sphaeroides CCNUC1]